MVHRRRFRTSPPRAGPAVARHRTLHCGKIRVREGQAPRLGRQPLNCTGPRRPSARC
ncbi:protein of unknown function [Cupriavidus neocaledonicus]|uniref:Uncharacterized protein n=1 Tax=Cupriavidus neocaledonicus TaxID=1040979 RepID=A0A375H0X4_9BURK|nr:protein of unknown function [Cupriavidus neocaledonicus]